MKVTDPVCHMTIEESEAVATSTYKGKTYYFCSKPCKEDFDKDPRAYTEDKAAPVKLGGSEKSAVYTCPMHPEIRQPGPGVCPKCGMALELLEPSIPISKTEWTCPMHPEIVRD